MSRSNYTPPRYVERAYDIAANEHDNDIVNSELQHMTDRHNDLLQALFRQVDDYSSLLQSHGPFHEVELGEPLSRFENILRKALHE